MADRTAAAARRAIERAGGLATPREIARDWGISEVSLHERIKRGTFAEPVKVAGRVRLYLRAEAERYRNGRPPREDT